MPEEKPKHTTTIRNASALVDDCYLVNTTIPNAPYNLEPHKIEGTPFKFVRAFTEGQLDPFNKDFGALYINEETKEAIYVSRGTYNGGPRDNYNDWDYNFRALPFKDKCQARIADGVKNVKAMKELYPEYTFSVAGHSLGAFLAQGISKELDLYGIGFNGPSYEVVASGKFLMISNYNDLVGRLSIDNPSTLYVCKKDLPVIAWQDKGDFLSSTVDFVGQLFNFVGHLFADNIPDKESFHNAKKNVVDKLSEETKDVDFSQVPGSSPDNPDRQKFIDSTKTDPGNTLVLNHQPIFGIPPLQTAISKPSIVISDEDGWQISLKFTMPIEIPVEGIGNLFSNKMVNADGKQKETFTTEDGQLVCGIDEKGNKTVYTNDDTNGEEQSSEPHADNDHTEDVSPKEKVHLEIKTQSLRKKSVSNNKLPFAINKEQQQIYMEQLPLKQSIRALHNSAIIPPLQLKDPSGATNMGGALGLFIKTIHPSSDFYEKAVEVSGLGQIEYLSCLYGQWLKKDELAQPGDMVFIQSSFIKEGQAWGLMIEQKDKFNMDVMLSNGPSVGIGWPTAYLCTGLPMVVLKAFRPSLNPVINENSPEGQFWGPMMTYLKIVLENRKHEKPDSFIANLLKPKGILVASLDEFISMFSNDIKPVTDSEAIPFGAIVFTENHFGIGIMLSDYTVFGIIVEYKNGFKQSEKYSLEDFKSAFYWLPKTMEQLK